MCNCRVLCGSLSITVNSQYLNEGGNTFSSITVSMNTAVGELKDLSKVTAAVSGRGWGLLRSVSGLLAFLLCDLFISLTFANLENTFKKSIYFMWQETP